MKSNKYLFRKKTKKNNKIKKRKQRGGNPTTHTYPSDNEYGYSTYTGDWVNEQPEGKGQMIFTNGDKYIGEWRNGKRNGKGKLSSPNFTYEGDFINGDPNGIGKITTPYLTYDGEFANGRMTNGNGKMIYPDGTVYDGEFKNGRIVWKNDVDCENNAEIEDPISLEQIPTGSGFRLSTELLPSESVGRCYDVNNLIRIRDNISPLYRKPFTDLDRERMKAYKASIGEPVGGKTRKARKTYKKSSRVHK